MSFDHLWAGWRSEYVTSVSEPEAVPDGVGGATGLGEPPARAHAPAAASAGSEGCVFCRLFGSDAPDEERHVVWEGALTVVVLNAYPYASGHVLVMPRRHVADLGDLEAGESSELWETARRAVAAVQRAYSPDGCNLGANFGRAAGAGIPRHVHLHVLPRWVGDTNFMTTIASTRVLPEALPVSWARLRAAWRS